MFTFRFEYDRKMSELSCADEDHPLKPVEAASPNKPDKEPEVQGVAS